MKSITARKLAFEEFRIYGAFTAMINPRAPKIGEEPVEFFRDMVQLDLGNSGTASFSTCRVLKRDPVISALEYHSYAGEGILPLDGDILLTVAPATATDKPQVAKIEVFYVPQGTFVAIRPGVWHCAPFAAKADCVNVAIILPERAYANDCCVAELPEKMAVVSPQ